MIARDKKQQRSAGFIQDFDYSFSWMAFLAKHKDEYGWDDDADLAIWEKYCVEHGHEQAQEGNAGNDSKERTVSATCSRIRPQIKSSVRARFPSRRLRYSRTASRMKHGTT